MKKDQDFLSDIAEIRSMMERSSKFLSLSGWAGVMAGIYGIVGAYIAHTYLKFKPDDEVQQATNSDIIVLGAVMVVLAIGTAAFLSYKRAQKRNEKVWNKTSKRLMEQLMVPLIAGGLIVLLAILKGYYDLLASLTLVFYGIAMFSAGAYTFKEVRILGVIQVVLGLLAGLFTSYGLLFWALGFGFLNLLYGIYIYIKYER